MAGAKTKKGISYKTGYKALKKMITDKLGETHEFSTKKERKDAIKIVMGETKSAFENGITDYLDTNIDKSIHKFYVINKIEPLRENKKVRPIEALNKNSIIKKVEPKANLRENKKVRPIEALNTMTVRNELYHQITGALKSAKFPINTQEQLIRAFPKGTSTKCKSEGVEMTVGEVNKLLKPNDFPFKSAGQVANTILEKSGL